MAKKICFGCMEQYDDQYNICPYCGYIEGTGPKEPYHLMPGTVLQGKYIVGKTIGYGGFGVTYIGFDYALGHKIAIKEYLPGEFSTRCAGENSVTVFDGEKGEQFESGVSKFTDEARKLAAFNAIEGIVSVYDCFEENNTAYIVMEYLEGRTLKDILEQEGKMDFDRAVNYIVPILDALTQVHSVGLLHRDISPDNIFVTNDGRVKLIDFGAARYASSSHSKSLSVIVKPGYAPQEQYRSRGDQGPWSDVYACAATLYKMITGVTPQDSMERGMEDKLVVPSKLGAKLPKDKQNAIMNALNLSIEKRTKSAEEFKENLLRGSKRVSGGKKTTILPKWPLWLKIVSGVGAAAVLVAVVMIIRWVVVPPKPDIKDGIRTPYVVGKTVDDAEKIITDAGLLFQITDKLEDDNIPKDYVLTQSKNAGEEIAPNTAVEVTVSAGGKVIYMGNYIGMLSPDAKKDLDSLGLNYMTVEGESEIAPGYIYDQNILPDTEVNKGSEVTLSVSTGISTYDAAKTAKVPQLIGKSWEEGRKTVRNNNLYIRLVGTEYSMTIPKGQIFEQSPVADSNAKEGDIVDVKISLGIMTVRVPDVQFKDKDEAKDMLEALGLKVVMTEEESIAIANNHVIRQSIEPGTEIEVTTDGKPTEITIVISKGIKGIVPDVVGKDLDVAKRSIENAGLKVGKISYADTDKQDQNNKVSKQSPVSGKKVDPGSAVDLTVYQYKGTATTEKTEEKTDDITTESTEESKVKVPDVVGKDESTAKSLISSAGLNPNIEYKETDKESQDGKVASQSPAGGTLVSKQSRVDLIIYFYTGSAVTVKVPDVVGLTESAATTKLKNENLKVSVKTVITGKKADDGKVKYQNPAAGKEVNENSVVEIAVYKFEGVIVRDVVGMNKTTANEQLTADGLTVSIEYEKTSDKSKDKIVKKQSLTAGTEVEIGTKITLTAYAYEVPDLTVPDLIGKTKKAAVALITEKGLTVGNISYEYGKDESQNGKVIKQSKAASTIVKQGTTIDITVYVFNGKKVPDLYGKTYEQAVQLLDDNGLNVGDVTYKHDSAMTDGKVMAQDTSAGTIVDEGSYISLTVCDNTKVTYYRYKTVTDYETTTTTSKGSLGSDWEYVSEKTDTSYGNYSDWTTTPIKESDTVHVETKTESVHTGYNMHEWNYSLTSGRVYCDFSPSTSAYVWYRSDKWVSVNDLGNYQAVSPGGRSSGGAYPGKNGGNATGYNLGDGMIYFIKEKTYENRVYYRSCPIIKTTTYTYRKPIWSSWSSWSRDYVSEDDTTKVEVKTIYWDETP